MSQPRSRTFEKREMGYHGSNMHGYSLTPHTKQLDPHARENLRHVQNTRKQHAQSSR